MKKAVVFLVLGVFVASGTLAGMENSWGQQGAPSGQGVAAEEAYVYSFTFAEPVIAEGEYVRVGVEGCSVGCGPGEPALPCATHTAVSYTHLTLPTKRIV